MRPYIEKFRSFKPGRILDIGCGRGEDVSEYASHHDLVIGLDIKEYPEWEKLKTGNKNIEFIVASATALPFSDKFFDYVCCCEVLGIKPKTGVPVKEVIPEVMKVLKDDGVFYASHPIGENYISKEEFASAFKEHFKIVEEMLYERSYAWRSPRLIVGYFMKKL